MGKHPAKGEVDTNGCIVSAMFHGPSKLGQAQSFPNPISSIQLQVEPSVRLSKNRCFLRSVPLKEAAACYQSADRSHHVCHSAASSQYVLQPHGHFRLCRVFWPQASVLGLHGLLKHNRPVDGGLRAQSEVQISRCILVVWGVGLEKARCTHRRSSGVISIAGERLVGQINPISIMRKMSASLHFWRYLTCRARTRIR